MMRRMASQPESLRVYEFLAFRMKLVNPPFGASVSPSENGFQGQDAKEPLIGAQRVLEALACGVVALRAGALAGRQGGHGHERVCCNCGESGQVAADCPLDGEES
jgi:hypothetical protein